ncbi:Endonuclease/exonuclease/phosphatase [Epithele typhae]|uniref:Endonuclease/exonuclease/phosphatase n=1 Tax=Epithele typhae TaxID=378194 RepID=UPI002008404D|nr:Endonuclease/exonuclease/phosphatase [Epithele typhae]KAH9929597.1 Endonuclease/exonuclease/phosphatase [Epithele typhae]
MMSENERRLVDGCATFYKASKYTLVEKHLIEFSAVAMQRPDFKKTDDMFNRVLGKDHIAVVTLLENKETGTRIIIANTHLHWDPAYRDVKLVQVALLIEEVEKIAQNFAKYPPRLPPTPSSAASSSTSPSVSENNASSRPPPVYSDGYKIPVIVCGDFNSIPNSGVYEFLSNGTIAPDHEDFMSHTYGKYTTEGIRHRLGMKSAYAATGEPPFTNFTTSFYDPIDYIWYSTSHLSVNSVLGPVDPAYIEKQVGFPNAHFPSDHLAIVSEFRLRPQREVAPPTARPPPVFPESSRAHA